MNLFEDRADRPGLEQDPYNQNRQGEGIATRGGLGGTTLSRRNTGLNTRDMVEQGNIGSRRAQVAAGGGMEVT
jgi:hypothetical protein